MKFIDLNRQRALIQHSLDARMQKVFAHGNFIMGEEVIRLEQQLADYVQVRHCITVANGTDALQLAMMALDIQPGDEIITTPFTFFANAEAIMLLRAKPVFVDIDPDTYNIDPEQIAVAITNKTKAILAVDLYGQCADFDKINAIADANNLAVIEDAAQSFGASYQGRSACSLATIATTSFFPSKPLGCYGDGGACFTNNDVLASRVKQLRVHGQDKRYHHVMIGVNSRLDTLQAAILLAKMEVFPEELQKRIQAGEQYTRMLSQSQVKTPVIAPGNVSVYGQYTIEVERRDFVQATLQEINIPTIVHYPIPLHLQPALACLGYEVGSFPVAESAAKRVLSLPMHGYLSVKELNQVGQAIDACMQQMREQR